VSVVSAEGERDATIIAFPLQRVTPPSGDDTREAVVIEMTGITPEEPVEALESLTEEPTERQRRRAHNVAVHALATRDQSREEIERRLLARQLPDDAVNDEIERLEALGLINDENLARELVDRYALRQGLARQAVAHKMRARNIAPEIISRALESVSDDDEQARLLEVASDRARALRSLAPEVAKRRLVAYLQRRGFRGNDIFSVVDQVLEGSD
jgi:regulatory protein